MKNKQGVSIIILVITVIVMAILAAVVVSIFLEDDPIFLTKKQVFISNITVMQERLDEVMTSMENKDPNFSRENVFETSLEKKKEYIPKVDDLYLNKVMIESGKVVLDKSTLTEKEIKMAKEEKFKLKAPYYDPPVPTGFTALDPKTKWNEGFRIKDSSGNQFVWIPAMMLNGKYLNGSQPITEVNPSKAGYNKEFGMRDYSKNKIIMENLFEKDKEIYVTDKNARIKDANIDYKGIVENVEKYGGFYISAFEIGENPTTTSLKSKSTRGNQIKRLNKTNAAETMDAEYNYTSVYTFLPTLSHYDTMLTWLIATGKKTESSVMKNSNGWGIYIKDAVDIYNPNLTGSKEKASVANIYDLAGNSWEATQGARVVDNVIETYPDSRIHRGGSLFEDNTLQNFAFNLMYNEEGTQMKGNANLPKLPKVVGGYRVCLYIK